MYGVVLWSDAEDLKAVIWCEDHGDLAFYNGNTDPMCSAFELDAGDLVQFDLSEDRHLRFVRNPRVVADGEYPELARELKVAQAGSVSPVEERGTTNVIAIDFATRKHEQRGDVLAAV